MARSADSRPGVFLTAEWRQLAMVSFEIDPAVLEPYLPPQLELDFWNGQTFVSLVGFLFRNTRVLGVPIPWHRNFAELNLRFYVRRGDEFGVRRGVMFIREIVPRWAVSCVARRVYQENYLTLPMRHRLAAIGPRDENLVAEYAWRFRRRWNRLALETAGPPELPRAGSLEAFLVDQAWGYCRQRGGGCLEYGVEHPPWRIRPAGEVELACDAAALYGAELATALDQRPQSAFLVEGSAVAMRRGVRLAARLQRTAHSAR